jgi:hypothetical protein
VSFPPPLRHVRRPRGRIAFAVIALLLCLGVASQSWAASFLFDATHAETAGNADWVIDQDSNPQRFPTPDQATVTGSTAETYWRGAISAWGIELVQRGHQVETLPAGVAITYLNAGNAQDLSQYQVFVVDEPNKAFTAAEKTAILNFVQAGGSLFMVADHAGSDRDGDGKDSRIIWNELFSNNTVQTAPFGIIFNNNNISPSNESADSSPSNPITNGVAGAITQFDYAAGCSLTIDLTKNASTRAAVWTSSTHTNSNVMVAYGTFGAGKFVAIGDSSPTDDGTGASGNDLFDGWNDAGGDNGDLIINASLWLATAAGPPPPANDNFAAASTLNGSSASTTGTNVNATKETGEPNHGGNTGGKSIWWKWTAPSSGNVVIDTDGSNFDTLLGVYTGSAVNALTLIAGDNNGGPSLTSRVTFAVTAGVIYRIAIDGMGGVSGNTQLNLVLSAPPPPSEGTIASWNFDAPPYPNPLPASAGAGSIDFTGWGGVVTSFGGLNGTQALALQGTEGNGTYIEFRFSMTGYAGLTIAFATRGTATGYNSGLWSWSANGGPFTTLPGVNTATISTSFIERIVDFSGQTALNNGASVRLRYTLSGATGASPNNRIDDFVISATLTPTVSVVVNNSDAYEQGSQPASITVSSSLTAGAGGLPVQFQTSGSAIPPGSPGADYALSGNSGAGIVTIPAGATSAMLVLTPAVDNDPTEFDETATVTLQPAAGYFVGSPSAGAITIHDDTPYTAAWVGRFPGFNGASAATQIDIEGDAISNFLEFAFDGDPFRSDRGILPVVGKMNFPDPNDGNILKPYPIITFGRRTDASNLTYSVEISQDMVLWANDVEQVSAIPGPAPNMEQVVYRGLSPLSGNGAISPVFLRVRVLNDE